MADNFFGLTDTGKIRSNNEDTFIARPVLGGGYIAACVIDGVGGYDGGEVAARIAHDTILEHLAAGNSTDVIGLMKGAVTAANEAIYNEKKRTGANDQMACVLTLALVDLAGNKLSFAHVGDTRLYLYRDQSLIKITNDHSFVGFLEDSGRISEEAAMRHPKRNEINKALGFDSSLKAPDYIETGESPFLPGDMILLCSDGLSDMVSNNTMSALLTNNAELTSMANQLILAANDAGGNDNITVVLVRNDKEPLQHTATKPLASAPVAIASEPAYTIAPADDKTPVAFTAAPKKKKSRFPIFTVLFILVLAAVAWLVYRNYANDKQREQELSNTFVVKKHTDGEQLLADSIQATKTREVFMLHQPADSAIVITDSITINNDTLHIMGNGATLVCDTSFNGPAFILTSACRYLLLDSLTLENFDVGILVRDKGLHLRNVSFKNCRVPVQYNVSFPERPAVNGRFADTVFYNTDTLVTARKP